MNANGHQHHHVQLSCIKAEDEENGHGSRLGLEAAEGDEMFDIHPSQHDDPGHFRTDEVIDSLEHDEDDDDEDDDDEDEEEYDDDENINHVNGAIRQDVEDEEDDDDDDEEEEDDDIQRSNSDSSFPGRDGLKNHRVHMTGNSIHHGAATISTLPDMSRQVEPHFLHFPSRVMLTETDDWQTEENVGGPDWHLPLQQHGNPVMSDNRDTSMAPAGMSHSIQQQCHDALAGNNGNHIQNMWQTGTENPSKILSHQSWVSTKVEHPGEERELGDEDDDDDDDEEDDDDEDEDEEEGEDIRCDTSSSIKVEDIGQGHYHSSSGGVSSGNGGMWLARQSHQGDVHHVWQKEMNKVYPGNSSLNSSSNFLTTHPSAQGPAVLAHMANENPYIDLEQQVNTGTWSLQAQLPTGPTIGALPRQYEARGASVICPQQPIQTQHHQLQQQQQQQYQHQRNQIQIQQQQQQQQQILQMQQSYYPSTHHSTAKDHRASWPQTQAVHYQATPLEVPVLNHPAAANILPEGDQHQYRSVTYPVVAPHQQQQQQQQQHVSGLNRCKSQGHLLSAGGLSRGQGEIRDHHHQRGKIRAASASQARQHSHPYQMKENKPLLKELCPTTQTNLHSVKASHIVAWYIDYLILENEHLTQISRAFSLPVNLFHSDDFYFMDALKKKVHFPSLKFLSWMQQNLPSVNVNTVDFHEGRAEKKGSSQHISGAAEGNMSLQASSSSSQSSMWGNQQHMQHHHLQQQTQMHHYPQQQQEIVSWQNKSRRDIIHDVFFYFQHRRVTCQN